MAPPCDQVIFKLPYFTINKKDFRYVEISIFDLSKSIWDIQSEWFRICIKKSGIPLNQK